MWKQTGISLAIAALVLLLAVRWAGACGPFFPNTIIDHGDSELLTAPEGEFFELAAQMAPTTAAPFLAIKPEDCSDFHKPTAAADVADLRAALAEQKMPADKLDAIVKEYAASREKLRAYNNEVDIFREKLRYLNPGAAMPASPVLGEMVIPQGLPPEFEFYFRGAILYHHDDFVSARQEWQKVLDLPAGESKYRSVWAAYMIARSNVEGAPQDAEKLFVKVRELVKAGYKDSLGLAAASYGWEARTYLDQGNYERAVELYLLQFQSGDNFALGSLRDTCGEILNETPGVLQRVARHDASRELVTAYIVSKGGPYRKSPDHPTELAWLAAVESVGIREIRDADKLAWTAYAAGDYKVARRWLDRCKQDTPIANWIDAKLLLRAGKTDEAAKRLAQAVASLPEIFDTRHNECGDYENVSFYADSDTAAGELATLKLGRQQYVDALDLLYRHNWWSDAAYVAERILTTDELVQYVDKNWPQTLASLEKLREQHSPPAVEPSPASVGDLRYLLARRLVREGQLQQAAKYMPADYRKPLDEYARQLAAGNDKNQPQAEQATALWNAAKILRENGMELMGYELEPDAAIYDGNFEEGFAGSRLKNYEEITAVEDGKEIVKKVPLKIATASDDEKNRVAQTEAQPNKRFHYRYLAADLAWQAAEMMPDQSDQTALVLWQAGTWLKNRDPKAADKFYKALVRRCGQTKLGQEADSLRWFPKLPAATQPAK